jgi:serine phosphatase RsbU (regulator of sigma subunit)
MTSARPGRRLLAVAIIIALALAAAGVALAVQGYRDARAAELEELADGARAVAANVGQYMRGREQVLQALASHEGIRRGDAAAVGRRLAPLRRDALGFTGGVAWFDPSGRVRASAGASGASRAEEAGLRAALLHARSGGPYVSAALPASVFPVPAVVVAVPTLGGDGAVKGALAGALGLDVIHEVATALAPVRGGRTAVVDRAGRLIAAAGETGVRPVGAEPLVRIAASETEGEVRDGSVGGVRGLDGRPDQLVGFSGEPARTGWMLFVGRDADDALGDARRTLWLQIAGIALLVLVSLGGAVVVAGRLDRLAAERDRLLGEAQAAEGRAAFLAGAAAALDEEPRLAGRLQRLADLCACELGGRCRVELAGRDGEPAQAAVAPAGGAPPPDAAPSLTAPLAVGGRAMGSIVVARPDGPPFAPADEELAARVAEQAALQLESARRYEQEHEIAGALQQSLLPDDLPAVPGLALAARYLAAGDAIDAGGDWYEVLPLDDGQVALAVGDVVGKGARAAAAMGQLRTALRALAMEGLGPAELLARLSGFAETVPEAGCATVAYAVVDADSGELRYACAGHPYPVLAGAGSARLLQDGRGGPLAGLPSARFDEGRARLDEGDVIALYTDGLVERRREGLDAGFARLVAAAGGLSEARVEAFCDGLLSALEAGDAADDVALLVARRSPAA